MDWLNELDTSHLLQVVEQQLQDMLPSFSVRQLFEQLLTGELQLEFRDILQQLGLVVCTAATAKFD